MRVSRVAGDCLRPFIADGDLLIVEPGIEPRDGDLVECAMIYRRVKDIALGTDRGTTVRAAVKQLRIIEGRRLLACADGSTDDPRHEITGVVVAVIQQRWWRIWPRIRGLRFPVATPAEELDLEVREMRSKIERLERSRRRSLELRQHDAHDRAEMQIGDLQRELEAIELAGNVPRVEPFSGSR